MRKLIALLLCLLIILAGCTKKNDNPGKDDFGDNGTIVVYFSATGNTEKVAEMIAEIVEGKLVEINPAEPYKPEDLVYTDCRSLREQNDPSVRPEIVDDISLEGCTVLYLGYPIWYGQAPRILDTFAESHDLTGISVIPFCTSDSSDIGTSADRLAELAGSGNWVQGKRFPEHTDRESVEAWIMRLAKNE